MKNITVAVCVDDNGGMAFNKRRQSRDRVLISDLLSVSEPPIYITPFSEVLFKDKGLVNISNDPFSDVTAHGVIFVEDLPIKPHLDMIQRLIIYRWNRVYPSDTLLDVAPLECGFRLESSTDFVGSSHEKITKEIYVK